MILFYMVVGLASIVLLLTIIRYIGLGICKLVTNKSKKPYMLFDPECEGNLWAVGVLATIIITLLLFLSTPIGYMIVRLIL